VYCLFGLFILLFAYVIVFVLFVICGACGVCLIIIVLCYFCLPLELFYFVGLSIWFEVLFYGGLVWCFVCSIVVFCDFDYVCCLLVIYLFVCIAVLCLLGYLFSVIFNSVGVLFIYMCFVLI